jgi:hypothetical protein
MSGDPDVVVDSVLAGVATGGSRSIVVGLGVAGAGEPVSLPFPHAAAAATTPSTRPTRRMRMTLPSRPRSRRAHPRARVEGRGRTVDIADGVDRLTSVRAAEQRGDSLGSNPADRA